MLRSNHKATGGVAAIFAAFVALPSGAEIVYSGTIQHGHAAQVDHSVVGGHRHDDAGDDDKSHLDHPYQMTPRHGRSGSRDHDGRRRGKRDGHRGDNHHDDLYGHGYDRYGHGRDRYGYGYDRFDRRSAFGRGHDRGSSRHFGRRRHDGRYDPYAGSGYGYRYNPPAGSGFSSGFGGSFAPRYPSIPRRVPVPHNRFRR
jgi:hypothetical protein